MRRITFLSLLVAGCLLVSFPAFASHRDNCPGGKYSMMRGYRGPGGACAQMGLDNRHGVCRSGQRYEILCDDGPGGRYKTCQGPRRCDGRYVKPGPQRSW